MVSVVITREGFGSPFFFGLNFDASYIASGRLRSMRMLDASFKYILPQLKPVMRRRRRFAFREILAWLIKLLRDAWLMRLK